MRRKLGYIADVKSETKKSDYCALIEFQSKALCTKSAILIENEAYGKKAEVQWNDVVMKSENDEAITIHVNIGKSDSDLLRKDYTESWTIDEKFYSDVLLFTKASFRFEQAGAENIECGIDASVLNAVTDYFTIIHNYHSD